MYVQQRDEYLESVCEMAIRKVSIITIFGSLTNSTMKIDHYQLGERCSSGSLSSLPPGFLQSSMSGSGTRCCCSHQAEGGRDDSCLLPPAPRAQQRIQHWLCIVLYVSGGGSRC